MSPRRDYEDDPRSGRDRDVERGHEGTGVRHSIRGVFPEEDEWLFDKDERKHFVFKVYLILSANLAVSFAIIFGLCSSEEIREFAQDYNWIMYIIAQPEMIIYFAFVCYESARKSFPLNFILLSLHTLLTSLVVAWVAAGYELDVIWMAFLATAIITITISFIAKVCPCDVTGCAIIFIIGFIAIMIFGAVAFIISFFIHTKLLWLIIAGLMVVLLTFYLMFVTQLILGGRKGEIETDETVLAVVLLYNTIMDIFVCLLRIIQAFSEE